MSAMSAEIPPIFERGSCLYHYTRLSTAIEAILPEWSLRLSPFSEMRDPRESKHWGYEAPVIGPAPHLLRNAVPRTVDRFAELVPVAERLKDRVKVLCLTEDDRLERDQEAVVFGRGFAHPRLWEHYADDHRGICLCFDRDTLCRIVAEGIAGDVHHGPVTYVDREIAPTALRLLLERTRGLPAEDAIRVHFEDHRDELFFTKLRDWETEVEYRFVTLTGDDGPIHVPIRNSLRALIIGEEVDTHYLPALSALCDDAGVEIHRIKWQHGRPRMIDPRAAGYS